jgi:Ca-activated chloride channel family protein
MTVLPDTFCLRPRDGNAAPPVFTGVRARGRIDGPLFTLDIRQGYRNQGAGNLEVVYTFPLPAGAVLLELSATLGDRRIACEILPRARAVERYEHALAEGDAPVLLESLGDGLYTANIGNLKPGESIELELRFAQLLALEAGRLRLAIPTTIAPRFGAPLAAGLQAQQVPVVDQAAEHPLALTLTVHGELAEAPMICPTHTLNPTREAQGLRLDLAPGARLDRDLVLLFEPPPGRTSMLTLAPAIAADPGHVALAAFEMPAAPPSDDPIALVMVVDCSGSMEGAGIDSARRALTGLLPALGERDTISLLRFGSRMELTLGPRPADIEGRRALRLAIGAMQADLGGTEIAEALETAFALAPQGQAVEPDSARAGRCVDVLLITDGQVWALDAAVRAARRGGHRIFAIGVGTAPAEAVLRGMVETTGGACEFATPGEALTGAATRMLRRIRQRSWRDLRVDWGAAAGTPRWSLPLPLGAFGQDTVLALAGFGSQALPHDARVRLLGRQEGGDEHPIAVTEIACRADSDTLARVAAARRIQALEAERSQRYARRERVPTEAEDAYDQTAQALALSHRLVTDLTHAVLVHQRADADRATDPAQLHRVASMLAAGWHGTSVAAAHGAHPGYAAYDPPAVWRSARPAAATAACAPPPSPSPRGIYDRIAQAITSKLHAAPGPAPAPMPAPMPMPMPMPAQPPRCLLDFARTARASIEQGHPDPLAGLPAIGARTQLDADEARALAEAHTVVAVMVPDNAWRWLLIAIWAARRGHDEALAAWLEDVAIAHHLPPALGQQVEAALSALPRATVT